MGTFHKILHHSFKRKVSQIWRNPKTNAVLSIPILLDSKNCTILSAWMCGSPSSTHGVGCVFLHTWGQVHVCSPRIQQHKAEWMRRKWVCKKTGLERVHLMRYANVRWFTRVINQHYAWYIHGEIHCSPCRFLRQTLIRKSKCHLSNKLIGKGHSAADDLLAFRKLE